MAGIVELKLNGHTNICGTNASGKTTLQRLIPVFYGEYPSRVVPATRDSFEKWYLPTETSYIVYEYIRGENELCQLVLSSSGQGVDYRFISKAFDLTDYSVDARDGQTLIIAPKELARVIKRQGAICSRRLNTKEFKAIIQNDRSMLASNRDLPGLARLFSLCEPSENLRHIEKLAKAVHSKEGKMETIKAMVAAILEEDGIQPGETKLSANKVEEWLREVKLVKSFAEIKPEFLKLEQTHAQYEVANTRLAQLNQQYLLDQSKVSKDKAEFEVQLNDVIVHGRNLESEWSETRDELNQTLSAAKADQKKLESDLDQIESDYDVWQDKDIETLQESLEQLPTWKAELKAAEQNYELLTNKHKDVEATYHKNKSEIQEQQAIALEDCNDNIQQVKEQISQRKQEQSAQLSQTQQKYKDQISTTKSDYQQQTHELSTKKTHISALLNNVGFSQDELTQLSIFEHEIKEASSIEDLSRERLSQINDELEQAKQARQKLDKRLEANRIKQQSQQKQAEQVESLLYPGQNTLLEFLRKQDMQWQFDIGKVIHPELLNRSDLKPVIIEQVESSLYGISLNLEAVKLPEFAESEVELKTKLDQIQLELSEILEQQNAIERELLDANKKVRDIELSAVKYGTELNNAVSARKRAQQDKDDAMQEFTQAVQERKKGYQKQLSDVDKQIAQVNVQMEEAIEELRDQQRDAEMEMRSHWELIISDLEHQQTQTESRLEQIKQSFKSEQAQLDNWLKSELEERGVDIDEIGQLKKKVASLKQDINATEQKAHLVNEYKHWYQTYYLGYKLKWQQALSDVRQTVSDSSRQLEKQQQAYKQNIELAKDKQKHFEKGLKEANENEQALNSIIKQLKKLELPKVELDKDSSSITQRVNEGLSLLAEREEQLANIKAWVEHFDQKIAAQSGTGFYDTWERSRQECSVVTEQGIRQLDHIKLVSHLDQLINVLMPQRVSAIREQGRIFGLALSEYYKLLKEIEGHIGNQSKRISKEVDGELFLDGVSDSAVHIRSKIAELEFWPELKSFNALYSEWVESGAHDLPSDEYVYSMRRVIDILGRSALQGGISKLLDIELHIKEGNSHLVIRTDRQLNESSSHGMAYLILCKFLLAFTRLLRGKSNAIIHWPIDELGTLHQSNIKKIFDACQNNNIHVVGAFPNPESEVLSLFENRYLIDKQKRQLQVVQPKVSAISAALSQKKAAQHQEVTV
jgi:hypothetical protein